MKRSNRTCRARRAKYFPIASTGNLVRRSSASTVKITAWGRTNQPKATSNMSAPSPNGEPSGTGNLAKPSTSPVEVKYATRAGASTSRCFGEMEDLLSKYAWYLKNCGERTWPVGSKKPNDFGLFDMHGTVWCWCQERYSNYPQAQDGGASQDVEDDVLSIDNQDSRVLRGGSFTHEASDVRSADRSRSVPSHGSSNLGFRAARTLPLVPP